MSALIDSQIERDWLDLSLAQRAVWLDASLSTSASAYTLVRRARITGDFDPEIGRQALTLVVARHDALRLRVDDELPRQWLHGSPEAPFSFVDLAAYPQPELALAAHIERALETPMLLGDRPLFSLELIALGKRDYCVFVRCHHLLVDDAALSMVLVHWLAAYRALTSDTPVELAPPSSYLDVIAADRAYGESARYKTDLAYWLKRFATLSPPLLPQRGSTGEAFAAAPNVATWTLEGAEYERFAEAIAAAGVTPQRAITAILAIVLGRRYGQADVTIGMALHRRNAANVHVVGMLAGVIAVRYGLRSGASFLETMRGLGAQMDRDLRHERLPIDALSRELGLSRAGLSELFSVTVSYVPALRGAAGAGLDGIDVTLETIASREASPLTLHAKEIAGGRGLSLDVATDPTVVDAAETGRIAILLRDAIDAFVREPGAPIETFVATTATERGEVVERWNATTMPYPRGTIDDLFRQRARERPEAIAVTSATQTLTYAQLDLRSDRLAQRLIDRGLERGAVIGVALERSVETVVALLAILKAGCTYLPIDPSYPSDRRAFMLADAHARYVIDDPRLVPGDGPTATPAPTHAPDDVAYIIYTSGSTGTPKGVAVPHAAAVNLAFARLVHDPIGPGDRILAAISVGFDVSIGQLVLPLLSGATVVVASDLRTLSAQAFWTFMQEHGVTHVNSVPSFFESILDEAPRSAALRRLMLGGEALTTPVVRRLRAALPATDIVNMYGPTEACIDATCYAASGMETTVALPIGTPLPNYRCYVLDARLEPVGIGVAGDLYLAGAGLAHGYVNAPALTAERFIADPFGGAGERLYRTGDRARWNAAGQIEFLGRADTQVKIRGHRIELGEIEAALRAHPAIAAAAVVADRTRPGSSRLVAYHVDRAPAAPDAAELRAHLASLLPDYMIPAAFARLDALPLTSNGKLDERALPAVTWDSARAYVEPRNARERDVAALFVEILGVRRAGATDNFFELGGHSLLATRLVSQIRKRFAVTLPLRAVFEAPSIEHLARRIDAAGTSDRGAFVAIARPDELPLSYTQERLWFLAQLQNDDTYNVPVAIRIRGPLERSRATRALEAVIARHEALRTRILVRDGRPFQQIAAPESGCVRTIDLSALDDAARASALEGRLRGLAHHTFDLASSAPIELELIALASDETVLAAVVHHSAFDGWSASLFFEDFARFYAASGDAANACEPLAVQYPDFALWQRAQDDAADLAYWHERLAGAPPLLEFPADYAPSERSVRGAGSVAIDIDAGLHQKLLALANANGASLFMLVHAAFATLLARWSGQNDLVIGTVVANRVHAEFERVIGCFINTLPLRTTFSHGATFTEVLAAVREDDLAAYEHQNVPFEKLVDALGPDRSLAQTPLFQAMLVLQNEPLPQASFPGFAIEPIELELGVAKFNLTLNLAATAAGGLAGKLEFASDTYDVATIERFCDQLVRLLEIVALRPSVRPMQIDLLAPGERSRVVDAWNATAASFPRGTADELFAERARISPTAVAVTNGAQSLTYAELDARTSRVAYGLALRGHGPQTVVGVALERSIETVVALLGILKAGCVYLPLDPAYPPERIAFMLRDARARSVITDRAIGRTLPESVPQLFPDEFDASVDAEGIVPSTAHTPDDVAYVIYTSGSTGTPKGVAVPHAAAVNLAFARRVHDPIGEDDRILAAISVGFDVSIGQLLLPLLSGATIVIASDVRTLSAVEFWAFLEAQRVTHVNSVPSFFESVLAAAPASCSLERLMLGGEALTSSLVRRLRRALPATQIVNMYGPTEACIDATFYPATGAEAAVTLPIGKPLPNYRAYVLNAALDPVGIGIAGDLYLAGAGLAHGYVNAPALTAERFIADPFGVPGARLYRTGDRARWNADGTIAFLGRADGQVKIRGHRIELGEIEAKLTRIAGIDDAIVVVRDELGGDRRLVAYYIATSPIAADAIRAELSGVLPGYMIPVAYVKLDAFPLTTNGKLDRKALPAPGTDAYAARRFEAPRGETEERIATILAATLALERVGRNENFFELGGHSLLAIAVVERMREADLPVRVRDLFAAPTVAGLAAAAGASFDRVAVPPNAIGPRETAIVPDMLPLVALDQREIDAIVAKVPGGAENTQDIYPLAPLQEGILFRHLMTQTGDAYLTPFLLGFDRRVRLEAFLDALRDVIARHDILRTAIHWEGLSRAVQVVLRDAPLPVEEVVVDDSEPESAARDMRERYDPRHLRIDVSQAPMLRAFVARDAANDRWLLLLLSHHLILDHTSLEVVLHEIGLIAAGRRDALAAPAPFRNFIAQVELGVPSGDHETFFRGMLGDVDEPTLPYGLARVENDGSGIRESSVTLDRGETATIRACARALGVGPAALLHLAWALVVARTSGRDDVVFGTLLLGRMESGDDSQRTLGMFINTLPLRVRVDGTSVEAAVSRTHESLVALLRHEHASLALAQRCSAVPAPAPLFSALFNFRHGPKTDGAGPSDAWPGVELLFGQERTDYPIAMAVDDRTSDFLITAQSDVAVDPAELCRAMHAAVSRLVHALQHVPQTPLRALRVLSGADRDRVVVAPNRTDAAYPLGTLHALFEAQVARTPANVAVIDGTASLTFAELDARAELLANRLSARGVRMQNVVGVALDRSIETVVSLLAILKLGAIYLPLDPAYPADRLRYMLADARASLVITNRRSAAHLASEIPNVDIDADEIAPARLAVAIDPAQTAYVIYTSGSTGLPKGVAVPHAAAVNLAFARLVHDPIGPGDRILAAISVGFDVSIGQLVLPLLNGATIVIASDLRTLSAREFWAFLEAHDVTHVNSVPSFFESVLGAAPASSKLVRLMLGGEALTAALVRRLREALPNTRVYNMYGPTEACIDATAYAATGDETSVTLPIGTPLPNYRAYVLDASLDPVGAGVAGDLYLAGAGLAHGYVGAAALTAERFVADPFGAPGSRLYRTGDRARWNADGTLAFLGRADGQVKIRGHRIEPGEIEARIAREPGVREAAVVVTERDPGDRRLVAYYTASDPIPVDRLRAALAESLPHYMVPAAFVQLAALPLTTNGKLDRKALPAPGAEAFGVRAFEAPAGEVEATIASIFGELLHVERVGRTDNFFELGGHSLLAMNVIERLRQAGLHVDVRALFSAPSVAELAAAALASSTRVQIPPNAIEPGADAISPEMVPLIALRQAEIDAIVASVPGGASNVQDIYPLAPLQEGILFRHLMSEKGDAYVAPFLLGFERCERLDAFLDALREMIARHDILRTAILWQHLDEPVQVVVREAALPVEELSFAEDAGDAAAQLRERFDSKHYRMDIRQAPMLRAFVTHDARNDRWLLMLLSHHLILDHTSLEVILHEVGLIASGRRADLPATQPFRNFIAQARLGIAASEHEAFFRELLGDIDEPTLPYGATHVRGDGAGIRESRAVLAGSLAARIRARAKALGVSPASIFHLAWALVLGQTSGRRSVVFGTLLFGRMLSGAEAQRTLGMFINTLPARVDIDGTGVEAAVRRMHGGLADLLRHEHASLALAQRCSGVPAPAPLFSALFNFRQSPPQAASDASRAWAGVDLLFAQERTDYPIALAVDDRTADFELTVQADEPADGQSLCRSMETATLNLLDALERTPLRALRTIPVLPHVERERVVTAWNATDLDGTTGTLYALFAAQVARTPGALAVSSGTDSLSYAQLDAIAGALANVLAARGARAGSVVGVALERSMSTVISLLAILKIGAIYLPLDPAYPPERLQFMLADADATHAIVDCDTAHLVPGNVIAIDVETTEIAPEIEAFKSDPEQTAYVIYTSGSTGKPKGVAVPHRAAVNLAFARFVHDPIGHSDRILAAISVGFDVSIGQLLLPLLSGATVVIASDLRTLSAREFWDFLHEQRVTHVNSVPSFFESILDAAPRTTSLVRLMLGGEALTSALVARLRAALPNTQVVNMYGPTEACIDATFYVATGDETVAALPIGKPLPNYRAYVLNDVLDPVGIGIAGDLYLAGSGLAHGYVGAAALTAERFIADPFGAPGARLYKTGDRARWNADGQIEFLGRADTQVKIRGHRVELGEIEAALLADPGIASAAVIASVHETGGSHLVAYYVAASDAEGDDVAAIRERLATRLPGHMIPAFFSRLDVLPLTINGKLDLRALPRPSLEQSRTAPFEAPQSTTERALQAIWQEVLGVPRLGRADNFFAVGGNSLAAVRVISKCSAHFATQLALKTIFEYPTIAQFAAALDRGLSSDANPTLVPLASGEGTPLFCVHPAGGLVFCYGPLALALGTDRAIYGFQARGITRDEPLALTIEEMAADYVRAIRTVQPSGPYHLLGMSSGGIVAYELAQQLARAGEAVPLLCLLDTSLPAEMTREMTQARLMRDLAEEIGIGHLFAGDDVPQTTQDMLERAWAGGHLPREVTLEFTERVIAAYRNTVRIYRAYVPQPWAGPVVLVRALVRRDGDAPPDWSAYVDRSSIVVDHECEHMELLSPSNVTAVVAAIEPFFGKDTRG